MRRTSKPGRDLGFFLRAMEAVHKGDQYREVLRDSMEEWEGGEG